LIEEKNSDESSIKEPNLFETERKSVKAEHLKLQKVFPQLKIAMLHGKMKPQEKAEVMERFKDGKAQVLISTCVVEVGVDVPNASVMIIEDAERFGLAQIHQFRGRVGRGEYQSYCLLFSNTQSLKALDRLHWLEEINDGFKLAEVDLEMRGPGAIFGTEQSGMFDLKMASMSDREMIIDASNAAKEIASQIDRYPKIKERLEGFSTSKHLE
jgi:ATP-dependent DNA helicase RecG